MSLNWIDIARKLQSISQAGLTYCKNDFDEERYHELRNLSAQIISHYSQSDFHTAVEMLRSEACYLTPKVDVRAVVFSDNKILMVREKVDGCWSVPGGWADVGLSPFEVAVKETFEEAGLQVRPVRLLAVFDKAKHHPKAEYQHVYKIFVLCEYVGGKIKPGMETTDAGYFGLHELPELSTQRITHKQLEILFSFLEIPDKAALCD